MLNNLRFATAIHILVLLEKNPEVWMSSEYIAGSINVNPVVVDTSSLLEGEVVPIPRPVEVRRIPSVAFAANARLSEL